ncbi:unnamed protein product [Urochloa humidicola]
MESGRAPRRPPRRRKPVPLPSSSLRASHEAAQGGTLEGDDHHARPLRQADLHSSAYFGSSIALPSDPMFLAQSFTAHDCWCSHVVAKKFTTFELAGGRSRGCLSCSCGRPRGKISLCWWSIHREGRIPITVLTDSEQMLGLGDLVVPRAPWCKGNLGSSQPDGPIPEFPCWYIKSGTKA